MRETHGSTSIIIIIPPGKMLLVVISRSLCECHMYAKPASEPGLFAIVPEGGIGVAPTARPEASGPKYGLPPYHGPLVTMVGSGSVMGPPPPTLPKGLFSRGSL